MSGKRLYRFIFGYHSINESLHYWSVIWGIFNIKNKFSILIKCWILLVLIFELNWSFYTFNFLKFSLLPLFDLFCIGQQFFQAPRNRL